MIDIILTKMELNLIVKKDDLMQVYKTLGKFVEHGKTIFNDEIYLSEISN